MTRAKVEVPRLLLAQPYDPAKIDAVGWWASEKLDGLRAYWDGFRFISRRGNVFNAPAWFTDGFPEHSLDGELWCGRRLFQKVSGIVRTEDEPEAWKQVYYMIYDVPCSLEPVESRFARIQEHAHYSWGHRTHPVMQVKVEVREQLLEFFDDIVAHGGEGVMLRAPGSVYEGKRSKTLLKYKPFADSEAIVEGYTPGKGKHLGRMGAMLVREVGTNIRFEIGTGFDDATRENPPAIGSEVSFSFCDRTDAGLPKCASYIRERPPE